MNSSLLFTKADTCGNSDRFACKYINFSPTRQKTFVTILFTFYTSGKKTRPRRLFFFIFFHIIDYKQSVRWRYIINSISQNFIYQMVILAFAPIKNSISSSIKNNQNGISIKVERPFPCFALIIIILYIAYNSFCFR